MWGRRVIAVGAAVLVLLSWYVCPGGQPGWAGGPGEPIVADLNGDGRLDESRLGYTIGATTTCTATVRLGLAGGGFGAPVTYPYLTLPATEPNCPDLGVGLNLDDDAPHEMVVAWFAGPPAAVSDTLLALDNYRVSRGFAAIYRPSFVGTADFNADGRLDVYQWTDQGEGFATYLNSGTGHLIPGPVRYCSGPHTHRLADFDSDGAMDVVIAYLEGCADFFTGVVVVLDDGNLIDLQGDLDGLRSWTVEVTDANADGVPDVTTYDQYDARVTTFIGTGVGTFVAAPVAIRDYPTVSGVKATGIRVLDNDFATTRARVTIWSPPRYGTVVVTTSRTIIYTPHPVHGTRDSFVYRITDEGRTSNAAVSLRIVG